MPNKILELNPEEVIDVRRAIRDYMDALRENILNELERGNHIHAKSKLLDLRRYEALYIKVRDIPQGN